MRLGQEVLNKISDLLVEIDKPKSPKRKPKLTREETKQMHFDEENRLYDNYKKLRDRAHERQKQQIKKQISLLNNFKVENKQSIFLNSRNNLRPIYQRTPEIIRQKQLSIEKKRTQINMQRERRRQIQQQLQNEEAQGYNFNKSRSKSFKKVASKKQLNQIVNRLTQRQRQRKSKANVEKMEYLKQRLLNAKGKPMLSKNTERIWEKVKNQQQLSNNVFERFDKYVWEHKKNQQEFINSVREKQTPFKPQISKNSIQILSKSPSRAGLTNRDMNRTKSCRCLEKSAMKKSLIFNPQYGVNMGNTSSSRISQKHQHISSTHAKSQISLSPYR